MWTNYDIQYLVSIIDNINWDIDMKITKSKTPTKSHGTSKQKPIQIYQNCLKILLHETLQQTNKWFVQNKINSFQIKNQRCLQALQASLHVLQLMIVENQSSDQFLNRIIGFSKHSSEKSYLFCRTLKYFEEKDYEFEYISSVAKEKNTQPISFYIKCRLAIIESFLNKTKKQLLSSVAGDEEQWYKIVKKIFKNVKQQQIIELFTDTIKHHYLNIKKNQNEQLNGAEVLRICQIIYRRLKSSNQRNDFNSMQERDQLHLQSNDEQISMSNVKQRQVKRLFQKNVVDGLESEDRELIRILSYKDNNIAKLLEKKHEKMIELIADDVESMRKNIEIEKNKYIQLWNQKEEILKVADELNKLTLAYISNDNVDNQEKILKAIDQFNSKYRRNPDTSSQTYKLRESKKNKRLIQLIQKQQKQKY